jgi:hypothetical protein
MSNKVLYLKSLFKNNKPDAKLQKLINEAIRKGEYISPKNRKAELEDSRSFILDNAEAFLWYAIDYSMADKITEDLFG